MGPCRLQRLPWPTESRQEGCCAGAEVGTEYQADAGRFGEVKQRDVPVYDDNPFYVRDYGQCT